MNNGQNGWLTKRRRIGRGAYGVIYYAIYNTKKKTSAFSPSPLAGEDCGLKDGEEVAVKRNLVDSTASFIVPVRELSLLNQFRHHLLFVNLKTISFGNPFEQKIYSKYRQQFRLERQALSPIKDQSLREDELFLVLEKAAYDCHSLIYGRDYSVDCIKIAMVQLLLATEYMHSKKVIHRDLKPSNLLMFKQGEKRTIKICDLGLSKHATDQRPMTPRTATSWYRAPEIVCRWTDYSYAVDMWSIGCIIIEMFSKKALLYKVNDNGQDIFSRMLKILPNNRVEELKLVDRDQRYSHYIEKAEEAGHRRTRRNNNYNSGHGGCMGGGGEQHERKRTWHSVLGLSRSDISYLNRKAKTDGDNYRNLLNLIDKLLRPNPEKRCTASEALAHPFFEYSRGYIQSIREAFPPVADNPPSIKIIAREERRWAANVAFIIFNNKEKAGIRDWYTNRIIFQAIDIFDRYLVWLDGETERQGYGEGSRPISSQYDIHIYFMVCVYLAMKLFTTTRITIQFEDIIVNEVKTEENIKLAYLFEKELLQLVLNFMVYRPTVYEAADYEKVKLSDCEVRNLLRAYGNSPSVEADIRQLFRHYLYEEDLPAISAASRPDSLLETMINNQEIAVDNRESLSGGRNEGYQYQSYSSNKINDSRLYRRSNRDRTGPVRNEQIAINHSRENGQVRESNHMDWRNKMTRSSSSSSGESGEGELDLEDRSYNITSLHQDCNRNLKQPSYNSIPEQRSYNSIPEQPSYNSIPEQRSYNANLKRDSKFRLHLQPNNITMKDGHNSRNTEYNLTGHKYRKGTQHDELYQSSNPTRAPSTIRENRNITAYSRATSYSIPIRNKVNVSMLPKKNIRSSITR